MSNLESSLSPPSTPSLLFKQPHPLLFFLPLNSPSQCHLITTTTTTHQQVLYRVMQLSAAQAFFNEPVDPDALGIPEYKTVVKNPVDLGTISDAVQRGGFYSSPAQVAADVRRVWANAVEFNGPGHEVSRAAESCSKSFEGWWNSAKLDDASLRAHFEQFGPVDEAVVMVDHESKRSRG